MSDTILKKSDLLKASIPECDANIAARRADREAQERYGRALTESYATLGAKATKMEADDARESREAHLRLINDPSLDPCELAALLTPLRLGLAELKKARLTIAEELLPESEKEGLRLALREAEAISLRAELDVQIEEAHMLELVASTGGQHGEIVVNSGALAEARRCSTTAARRVIDSKEALERRTKEQEAVRQARLTKGVVHWHNPAND